MHVLLPASSNRSPLPVWLSSTPPYPLGYQISPPYQIACCADSPCVLAVQRAGITPPAV